MELSKNHYDVIIIGAGFAGVTASRNLSQKGHNTLVLEGRDRMGGRTWYDHRMGENLEMGGTFIHWFQPNIWSETLRYGLEVEKLIEVNNAYWMTEGKVVPGKQADEFGLVRQGMKAFTRNIEQYFPRPYEPFFNEAAVQEIDHLSVADKLQEIKPEVGQEIYDVLDAYWCAYFCTDDLTIPALTQAYRWLALSYNDWDIMEDIFELYKFKHGTKSLLESIFNDGSAELRLSTPIATVEKTQDGHKLITRGGDEYTATAVIAAIPINTVNNIEFSPALADEIQEFSREKQSTSDGAKLWVKVRGEGVTDTFRLTAPSYPVSSMHTQFFDWETNEAIIMGYVSNARKLNVTDPEEVQTFLRRWLPGIEVIDSTGHKWNEDEFSQGTWPVLRTNQLTKYGKAVRQSQDGLYLAGSDYADGWAGFMDGAIESGGTTGERVDAFLKQKAAA